MSKTETKAKSFVFTFGLSNPCAGHFVRIEGSYMTARAKMIELFKDRWAFQYSDEEWDAYIDQLNKMGVNDLVQIHLDAYARYIGE